MVAGACASTSVPTPAGAAGWPDPRRLEADIVAFERADSVSFPPAGAVVCVGSSTIRMWRDTIAADLAPLVVVPRGFGGSTMRDVLHFLDRIVIRYRPRGVLLYEGDNDLQEGVPPEEVVATFDTLTARLHAALPRTRLYVMSIKPSPARWGLWPEAQRANALLWRSCAADSLLACIDVAGPMLDPRTGRPRRELFGPDSLHLSAAGYRVWREAVRSALLPEGRGAGGKAMPPPARDSTQARPRSVPPHPCRRRGPSVRRRKRTPPRG